MPITGMEFALQVLLPGAIAIALMGILCAFKWTGSPQRVSISATVAMVVGSAAAIIAAGYMSPFYDGIEQSWSDRIARVESPAWMIVLLGAALLLVVGREMPRVPAVAVWIARVLIAFSIGPLMLMPWLRFRWDTSFEKLAWIGGIGGVMLVTWFATRIAAGKEGGRATLLLTALSAATLAVSAATSGSFSIGALCGAIALIMGLTWIGWLLTARYIRAGVVDVATILLMALVIYVKFYLDETFSFFQAALILAAPLAVCIPRLKPVRHRPRWLSLTASLVVAFVLLGIAGGIAIKAFMSADAAEVDDNTGGIDYGDYY